MKRSQKKDEDSEEDGTEIELEDESSDKEEDEKSESSSENTSEEVEEEKSQESSKSSSEDSSEEEIEEEGKVGKEKLSKQVDDILNDDEDPDLLPDKTLLEIYNARKKSIVKQERPKKIEKRIGPGKMGLEFKKDLMREGLYQPADKKIIPYGDQQSFELEEFCNLHTLSKKGAEVLKKIIKSFSKRGFKEPFMSGLMFYNSEMYNCEFADMSDVEKFKSFK